MPTIDLEISKNWFTGSTVQETNWDRIRSPLIEWSTNTNYNLNQLAKDCFGATYSIDNDGNANLSTDLQTQISNIILGSSSFENAVDGDWYAIQMNNTQANVGGSTNETVNLGFGFGTDTAVARITVGKEQDYASGANSDSFMAFYTDLNGTLTEGMRITSGGNIGIKEGAGIYFDGADATGNDRIYKYDANTLAFDINGKSTIFYLGYTGAGISAITSEADRFILQDDSYFYLGLIDNIAILGDTAVPAMKFYVTDASPRLTLTETTFTVANGITFATDTVNIDGGAIDGTTIGAVTPSTGAFTSADIDGGTWQGTIDGAWTAAGQTCADLGTVTTADINGGTWQGTIDGAVNVDTGNVFAFNQVAGTSPFTVASTTVVSNLNADQLDGQQGSYYQNASNLNAGSIPDGRIPQSAVTQHEASLSLSTTQITSGTLGVAHGGTGLTSSTGSGTAFVKHNDPTIISPTIQSDYILEDGYGDRTFSNRFVRLQTTDATTVAINITATIGVGVSATAMVVVSGIRTDVIDASRYLSKTMVCHLVNSGAGATISAQADGASVSSSYTAVFNATGTNLSVDVTGLAGNTVEWSVYAQWISQ